MEKRIGFLYLPDQEEEKIKATLKEIDSVFLREQNASFKLDSLLVPSALEDTLLIVSVSATPALAAGQIPTFLSELLALRAVHRSFSWVGLCSPELEHLFPLFYAMGAVACFSRPFNIFKLVERLDDLENNPLPFRSFGLIDSIMMGHFLGIDATYSLSLEDKENNGFIALKQGEFWHAACDKLEGKEALHELLSWENPAISVGSSTSHQSSILGDFWFVLKDFCATVPKPEWEISTEKMSLIHGNLPTQTKESKNMADLNSLCREVVDDVTDALACGIVDLNSGMLLAAHHNVHYFTQAYLDAVSAAAVDMFRGKTVRRVEQLLTKHRGKTVKETLQEVFTRTENTFHFMQVIQTKGVVVVLVTRTTTNQGMGWAGLRGAVLDIEDAL